MIERPKCFVIMPITTPETTIQTYNGDKNHFANILEHLFIPALDMAGFEAISPKTTGSDLIHAEIIANLAESELVLCDMSILNPNVFFEFGIRCALNKPVALVIDDKTQTIPFDTSIINCYFYNSSPLWNRNDIEEEIKRLSNHISVTYNKSSDHNVLWKYFGTKLTPDISYTKVIGIAEVEKAWRNIRTNIRPAYPALDALLNSCKLLDLRDHDLYLGFQSNILIKKMEDPEMIQIVQKAIREVLNEDLSIKCVLIKPQN